MKKRKNLTNFDRVQATLHGYADVATFANDTKVKCWADPNRLQIDYDNWFALHSKKAIDAGTIDGNVLTFKGKKNNETLRLEFYHYQPVKL